MKVDGLTVVPASGWDNETMEIRVWTTDVYADGAYVVIYDAEADLADLWLTNDQARALITALQNTIGA